MLYGDPCHFDRWRWLKKHLLPGPLKTLDAGCGSGAFTLYAAKRGNEALGLSFDHQNNEIARGRAEILKIPTAHFLWADLRKLDEIAEGLGPFDQIICCEVIEHIQNDKKLIGDLTSLLKPGGRLLLTTPFKYYQRLVGDQLSRQEDGGHVRWGYTHEEMVDLLNEHGFDVVTQEYVSGWVSQQLTNVLRILRFLHPSVAWLLVLPWRIFQLLDPFFTKMTGNPFLCIGMVAIKRS